MADHDAGEETSAGTESDENDAADGADDRVVGADGVESLPAVDAALTQRLHDAGYESVGDVADASVSELTAVGRVSEQMAVVLRLTAGASPEALEVDVAAFFSDIEDLPGVNTVEGDVLREAGIGSLNDIAAASMDELTALDHIETERARTLKRVVELVADSESPSLDLNLAEQYRDAHPRHVRRQERTAVMLFSRLRSALDLGPGTMRFAVQTLKRAIDADFLAGRPFRKTICASTVIASRATDDPRSIAEVADVADVDERLLGRVVPDLSSTLGLEVRTGTAEDFVDRYVDKLERLRASSPDAILVDEDGLPRPSDDEFVGRARRRTRELLDARSADEAGASYQPRIVAAGAVYAAYLLEGVPLKQDAVADAFDTSSVSVKKHYKRLMERAGYDPDPFRYRRAAREGETVADVASD